MWRLLLCETREYSPRLIEHWLHSVQKHPRALEVLFKAHQGKVEFLVSEDLSSFFLGSRSEQVKSNSTPHPSYYVHQKKGPLLPIRRFAQLEDRVNKTHLVPLELLLPSLAFGGFVKFRLTPVAEHTRHQALRKVKQEWYEPERRFDQWEARGWFSWKLRKLWGPLVRLGLPHPTMHKATPDEQIESQHEREDPRRAILDKLSRPLFKVEISLSHRFEAYFHALTLPYLGEITIRSKKSELILSAEELATLLSPPNAKIHAPLLHTESTAYLPSRDPSPLKMSDEDRKRHFYLVGKTGMGKSTTLLQLYQEDLEKNHSIVLLDPHGDLIDEALKLTPTSRQKDLLWIDPSDKDYPLALNPLECLPHEDPVLKTSALVDMFEVLSKGSWGPRLEYILRNALLALTLAPNTTLLDLPPFLTYPPKTRALLSTIKDPELLRFFQDEFLAIDEKTRQEYTAPILNKVGPLLTNPTLRNIFSQPRSKLQWDEALNSRKILLISLSKGKLGEDQSRLLGMIFISQIQSALLRRASLPPSERNTVAITIDEFQNFTTKTLLSMLSELRKYGLALTLANQYLTQLPPEIQDAVLGNAGSLLCFRTSYADAQILAPSLGLTEEDLTGLAPFKAYARLLKNQEPAPLFRLELKNLAPSSELNREALREQSRSQMSRERSLVEEKIKKRYNYRE
jgi:hypothetical protein